MRSFKIIGKEISLAQIIFLLIWSIFFGVFIFYIEPLVKGIYLDDDIKMFETQYYWRIYFSIWALIFISLIVFKIKFNIELLGTLLLYFLCFYLLLQNTIVSNALYINQIREITTERKIYKLYNDKKYLQLFLDDEKEKKSIFDEKEINKINTFREKKNLKRIQDLPTHDSVCVDYKVGIFGIKYLK